MRIIGAALLATTLVASGAFAASPLPAGKPAGAKDAALLGAPGLVLVGVAIVATGIAITLSKNSNNGVTSPTTTSTSATGLP